MNGHVVVSIVDDGEGFNAFDYYHGLVDSNGHGLEVMRERAESVGGKFRVVSLPGKGTEIQIEVPASYRWGKAPWLTQQ